MVSLTMCKRAPSTTCAGFQASSAYAADDKPNEQGAHMPAEHVHKFVVSRIDDLPGSGGFGGLEVFVDVLHVAAEGEQWGYGRQGGKF